MALFIRVLLVGVFLAGLPSIASPNHHGSCNGAQDLRLDIGCVRGTTSNGVDKFLGVPFAKPPTGSLRFKAPEEASHRTDVINATVPGNCCWGAIPPIFLKTAIPSSPFDPMGGTLSEDCLTMNIYRPAGCSSNDNLPIVVWPFSGGFRWGCANTWDFTKFVQRSIAIGKPVIVVAPNYRTNVFGFLCGPDVPLGDLNAGIHDHFFAMEIVKKDAAALGGNSDKITVWGQSYGATMLEMEMLYLPSNKIRARAGILDSCTGPVKHTTTVAECTSRTWANLLNLSGCSTASNKIDCLRAIPEAALFNYTTVLPSILPGDAFPVIIDNRTIFDKRPSLKIRSGQFKALPLIMGRTTQDGTVFAATQRAVVPPTGQEDAIMNKFLVNTQLNNSTFSDAILSRLDTNYPVPAAENGVYQGPFLTGKNPFDRLSLLFTDVYFSSHMKMLMSANTQKGGETYGYIWDQLVPEGGVPQELGVYHGTNLLFSFDQVNDSSLQPFVHQYQDYYINFITSLNPGSTWQAYSTSMRKVLKLKNGGSTMIPDDIRQSEVDWINTPEVQAAFEK